MSPPGGGRVGIVVEVVTRGLNVTGGELGFWGMDDANLGLMVLINGPGGLCLTIDLMVVGDGRWSNCLYKKE